MRRNASRHALVTVLALGLLAAGPAWPGEAKSGPDQVVDGAKTVGRGVEETAKGVGKTVTEGAKEVGRQARPVVDQLHDRAKEIGQTIWEGMKSVGRTLEGAFTGKK